MQVSQTLRINNTFNARGLLTIASQSYAVGETVRKNYKNTCIDKVSNIIYSTRFFGTTPYILFSVPRRDLKVFLQSFVHPCFVYL